MSMATAGFLLWLFIVILVVLGVKTRFIAARGYADLDERDFPEVPPKLVAEWKQAIQSATTRSFWMVQVTLVYVFLWHSLQLPFDSHYTILGLLLLVSVLGIAFHRIWFVTFRRFHESGLDRDSIRKAQRRHPVTRI